MNETIKLRQCKDCDFTCEGFSEFMKHRKSVHKRTEEPILEASDVETIPKSLAEVTPEVTPVETQETVPTIEVPLVKPNLVPPSDSVTAEEVKQVQERSNSDKLRDAFASTTDADSKAAIGRILANPQVDYMTPEEIRTITFNQVRDGDGRAAVYQFFPETINE